VARIIQRIVSSILMMCGISLLVWGCIPSTRQVLVQTIPLTEMEVPGDDQGAMEAILEPRQVLLEWPSAVRIGDQEVITLAFEPAQETAGLTDSGGGFTDVYDRFNLMAESRYEVAGIQIDPANPVRESLPAGKTAKFTWNIRVPKRGMYPGRVWLSLRFLPLNGSQASEVPVFVHQVDIRGNSLLGLRGPQARLLGSIGVIVGLASSYDVMISNIKKLTTKERTKIVQVATKDT
jgi:hypothetical protein